MRINKQLIAKLKEKGFSGICKSIIMRSYYGILKVTDMSMHGNIAKMFWRLFQFLPVNNRLILFESEPDFCDNSWALYQYLKKERPHYHLVWIVKNPHDFKNEKDKYTSFVTRYGKGMHLRTIYYYATARYNFYTHWTFQPYIPRKGQTVVNLWHGGYPMKATKVKNCDYYDWLISMGEEGKEILAKYLGCPMNKVLALGHPRVDLLVKNICKGTDNPFAISKNVRKVILWMPTFRASVNHSLSEDKCDTDTGLPLLTKVNDIIAFNRWLESKNVSVIVKVHHLQAQKEVFKNSYSNFIILTDEILAEKGLQLYEILGKSDALLTDYSTVYWDYLVVDKPVGFILDDIDKYEASCGFNVDNIRDILKGEHIYDQEQLMQFIMHVLEGKDDYQSERRLQLAQKIQLFPNGGNCKNVLDHFGI